MAENSNAEVERRFLTLKEVCKYTGWGLTKTREIIKTLQDRIDATVPESI